MRVVSQRQAAKHYGVPRGTLQKILEGKTKVGTKSGRKPILGDLETKLVDYAVNRASMGIGFGKKQLFDYATQLNPDVEKEAKSASAKVLKPVSLNRSHEAESDRDILAIPLPHVRQKSGRNHGEKFFISTSEEAFAAKLQQKEKKEQAEAEKKMRQEKRQKLKRDKENKQAADSKKPRNKKAKDRTKCMYCEIEYCNSSVGWIKCKNCSKWACGSCAHLSRKRKAYLCDTGK